MTDATHFPAPPPDLRSRFDRLFAHVVRIAAFDRTRQELVRLGRMDDADLGARGTTRDAALRRIIGGRGMF